MTTNPLLSHLAWMTAHPFIPELHQDDCDDMACVRCEPTNPIERLNVPAAQVEQQLASDVYRKAMATTHSPSDRIAYAQDLYLVTHPKAPVSTDPDYPGFAEWVAQEEAKNEAARRNR